MVSEEPIQYTAMNAAPPRIQRRSVMSRILIALGLLGFTFILMGLLVGALIIQGLKSFVDHPDLLRYP